MESNLAFFKDKKILITGGGGYLGSKIAEYLVNCGAKIILADIAFNTVSTNLIVTKHNIKKISVDITKKKEIAMVCSEVYPDYIYHFAALLNRERDFSHYDKLYEVNVKGTINLLEGLQNTNYKGFFFSSTSEVYGNHNPAPFHENQIPLPASPYSLTKLMAEKLIATFSENYHKPYTILRIFNFFGPDMSEKFFLNQLIATLNRGEYFEMTQGDQIRDFLPIEQLITYILAISKSDKSNGETINICSGKATILKEIALELAGKLNKTHLLKLGAISYRENEIWKMIGMNKKLQEYITLNSYQDIFSHFSE